MCRSSASSDTFLIIFALILNTMFPGSPPAVSPRLIWFVSDLLCCLPIASVNVLMNIRAQMLWSFYFLVSTLVSIVVFWVTVVLVAHDLEAFLFVGIPPILGLFIGFLLSFPFLLSGFVAFKGIC